jgi:hypothetical protein
MRKLVIVCCLAAAYAASQPAGAKITAQSVLDGVRAKGPAAALKDYTAGSAQKWHFILKQIETGDSIWLTVASELRIASDASYSQDLDFSVATALTRNPSAVLRLKNFELERVCDVPYLEPSVKVVHDFQAKASAALLTVKDADLQERRKKCQAVLTAP